MTKRFSDARDQYVEGASSSKAQGKKPMEENMQLNDEDSDYNPYEEPVQAAKASGKKKDPELTSADYYELFQKHKFEGTRYPDAWTMRELGIADDVEYLFQQCHLGMMMHTPRAGYYEETIQFLSSLKLHLLSKNGGLGFITFKVFDQEYSMTTRTVEALFGFPNGNGTRQKYAKAELNSLWATIAYDKIFNFSRSKSSHIRSPVLRYFHKSLANVFFARNNARTIVNEEMELMDTTLKDLLFSTADGTILKGDPTNTSLSYILVNLLLNYKKWVLTLQSKGTTGTLCVGGLVTVLLEACRVPLQSEPIEFQWIDVHYLQQTHSLRKDRVTEKLVYNFIHPTFEDSQILLPCEDLTSFSEPGNIEFTPPEESLYMTKARRSSLLRVLEEDTSLAKQRETQGQELDAVSSDFNQPWMLNYRC